MFRSHFRLNMFLLVAAAVFVGVVVAEPTQPGCCVPAQWEGQQGAITGMVRSGSPSTTNTNAFISYDATNQRIASTSYIETEGLNVEIKTIQDYNKGMQYSINEKAQTCSSTPLTAPFQKICLPANAIPQGKFYFGIGSNTFDAVSFKVNVNGTNVTVVATPDGCIPMYEVLTSANVAGAAFMEAVGFVNLKPGIKDPTVFNVPSFCTQKKPAGFEKIGKRRGIFMF